MNNNEIKKITINGVECELLQDGESVSFTNARCVNYRPIPPQQKSLVQIAAGVNLLPDKNYRESFTPDTSSVYEELDRRHKEIDKRLKKGGL